MPAVKRGETRNKYVSRAIPQLMREGLTQKQAVGKSEGMFSGKWGLKKKRKK